jgi:hypothetical protein
LCRLASWSGLIATALILASLFNSAVTTAMGEIEQATPGGVIPAEEARDGRFPQSGLHEGTRTLTPATAALSDADDVRAVMLGGLP